MAFISIDFTFGCVFQVVQRSQFDFRPTNCPLKTLNALPHYEWESWPNYVNYLPVSCILNELGDILRFSHFSNVQFRTHAFRLEMWYGFMSMVGAWLAVAIDTIHNFLIWSNALSKVLHWSMLIYLWSYVLFVCLWGSLTRRGVMTHGIVWMVETVRARVTRWNLGRALNHWFHDEIPGATHA